MMMKNLQFRTAASRAATARSGNDLANFKRFFNGVGQLGREQHLIHYFSSYVSEPEVTALELKRELGVVDAQATEDGCLQVVRMHRILRDVVAVIVRRA
jgi:hypothetical protein